MATKTERYMKTEEMSAKGYGSCFMSLLAIVMVLAGAAIAFVPFMDKVCDPFIGICLLVAGVMVFGIGHCIDRMR